MLLISRLDEYDVCFVAQVITQRSSRYFKLSMQAGLGDRSDLDSNHISIENPAFLHTTLQSTEFDVPMMRVEQSCILRVGTAPSTRNSVPSSKPSSKSSRMFGNDLSSPGSALISLSFCKLERFLNRIDDAVVISLQDSSGRACPAATRPTRTVGTIPWRRCCGHYKGKSRNELDILLL